MAQLGENLGVTLYAQIASDLRTQIASGTWSVGQMIPTVDQLSRDYGAAKITIRQAVKLLANDGLLKSQRGRGTFVSAAPPRDFPDTKIARIIEARTEIHGFKSISRSFVKTIPPLLTYGTDIASGDFRFIKRVHRYGNKPLYLIDLYIDKGLCKKLKPDQENLVAVVRILTKTKIETEVETTVTFGSADAETSRLLGCPLASPIAQVIRLVVDLRRAVMFASRASYAAELFAMQTLQTGPLFISSRQGSSVRKLP